MAVHNNNYKEIIGLLGDMYVKYIDIDNSVTSTAPFIKKILKDISESEEDIVDATSLVTPAAAVTAAEEAAAAATTAGSSASEIRTAGEAAAVAAGRIYRINNDAFTDLINQAIYTKINIMEVKDNVTDNLANTKGYLKFAKGVTQTSGANVVKIIPDRNNIFNLICSMNLVNVFIDILEAYNDFLENENNITHLKKNVNNIIIVNKKARDKPNSETSDNYGYWIDGSNGSKTMSESTLFLSINSYEDTGTNKLFTDLRVTYDGPGKNVAGAGAPANEITIERTTASTNGGLFLDGKIRNVAGTGDTTTLSGIVIKKLANGRCVIKQLAATGDIYLDDNDNSDIEETNLYDALFKRDKRLLQNFLNIIINLNLVNRKTQISGLLNFFKIIKVYFYIAITTGNMLYNSIHNKKDLGSAAVTACGSSSLPGACSFTVYSATASNSTGYGIKFLTKAQILQQSTNIYSNTGTVISDIKLVVTAPNTAGSDALYSVFGLAYTNNKAYVNDIIDNITKIHMKSAIKANISNSDEFAISDKGFMAEVLSERLIKIKTRLKLFKHFNDANKSASTRKDNSIAIYDSGGENFYIKSGSTDRNIIYNDNGEIATDDNSFKKSNIESSELPIAVKNQLIDGNMDVAKTHIININNTSYPIISIQSDTNHLEFIISARLIYPTQNDEELKDIPILTLPYESVTLFDSNKDAVVSSTIKSANNFENYEHGNIVYFHIGGSTDDGFNNNVYIAVKKPLDYKNGYINNVDAINNINEQINSNQSKIKNIKTLYNLNKSKNNLLYYQLVSYIILLLGIIIILGLTYVMKMEKPIIKLVSSVCFGIVVLQVVTYYILGVLYIEAFTQGSNIETFTTDTDNSLLTPGLIGNKSKEFSVDGNDEYPKLKVNYVNNQLMLLNTKIIKAIEIANVSVSQGDATTAYTTLLGNTSHERASRAHINKILSSEADSSLMHIDLLKYSASVYSVYIKSVLMVGLTITALFTINLYTDNKYMEIIAFICIFILVVIFSYYLIYSNAIVRTKSNNIYWGKENKSQYD